MLSSCLLCGEITGSSAYFCIDCIASLPTVGAACDRCGRALPERSVCGRCLKKPPEFSRYFAAYWYQFPIDRLIIAAKYHHRLEILTGLGWLFSAALQKISLDPLPQALVAVPLHRLRMLRRGYNQSLEIARPLAQALDLPLLVDACSRHRYTRPQSQLVGKDRRRNVRGAFRVGSSLGYNHVAIIDDVFTSGSTVTELSRCLLRSGCERVDVWTFARAEL